jgi:hypothetical protein
MTAIAEVAPVADHAIARSLSRLAAWVTRLGAILRHLGPYAAIEILLPGGTLLALLLWVYRRRRTRLWISRFQEVRAAEIFR